MFQEMINTYFISTQDFLLQKIGLGTNNDAVNVQHYDWKYW